MKKQVVDKRKKANLTFCLYKVFTENNKEPYKKNSSIIHEVMKKMNELILQDLDLEDEVTLH